MERSHLKHLSLATAATLLALAFAPHAQAAAPAGYKVIVNDKNPVLTLTRAQLAALFLKKTTAWDDGRVVAPVDLPEESATRKAFSDDALKKSVPGVKSYWQQRIFSGRGVPPTEKASDDEVVAYVRSKDTAIGYVSAQADVGTLKIITITE
jgi:ABC-type phosphate transport system substrate-binding protein